MSGEWVYFILRWAPYPLLLAAELTLRLLPAHHDPADTVSDIIAGQLHDLSDVRVIMTVPTHAAN